MTGTTRPLRWTIWHALVTVSLAITGLTGSGDVARICLAASAVCGLVMVADSFILGRLVDAQKELIRLLQDDAKEEAP